MTSHISSLNSVELAQKVLQPKQILQSVLQITAHTPLFSQSGATLLLLTER